MNNFKVGQRVRAVEDSHSDVFRKGAEGTIVMTGGNSEYGIDFDSGDYDTPAGGKYDFWWAYGHEIKVIDGDVFKKGDRVQWVTIKEPWEGYHQRVLEDYNKTGTVGDEGFFDEDCTRVDFGHIQWNIKTHDLELVSKRKEYPELTGKEKDVLNGLPSKWKYIARDRGVGLYVYTKEPERGEDVFKFAYDMGGMDAFEADMFKGINFKNSPWSIKELIDKAPVKETLPY